ncbi:MAG: hypothetical protein ACE5IM_11905 [Nitrospinota bacterium]
MVTSGSEPAKGIAIRCKKCHKRCDVPPQTPEVQCPGCGQGWRIRWFRPDVGMIIAPISWTAYQTAERRTPDE